MERVVVRVYDLSMGLAAQLSSSVLGTHIPLVPHTGVLVFGKEWFFSGGIQATDPSVFASTRGIPVGRTIDMGGTEVPEELFVEFLSERAPAYTPAKYNLLRHNCNHFSEEIVQFLCGKSIGEDILKVPEIVLASPFGTILAPFFDRVANQPIPTSEQTLWAPSSNPQEHDALTSTTQTPSSAPSLPSGMQTPQAAMIKGSQLSTGASAPTPEPGSLTSGFVTPAPAGSAHLLDERFRSNFPLRSEGGSTEEALKKLLAQVKTSEVSNLYEPLEATLSPLLRGETLSELSPLCGAVISLIQAWGTSTPEDLFALLYLLRLAVLRAPPLAASLLKFEFVKLLSTSLLEHASTSASRGARLMGFMLLSNAVSTEEGGRALASDASTTACVLHSISRAMKTAGDPQQSQVAAALLYNLAFSIEADSPQQTMEALMVALLDYMGTQSDSETIERLLLALGRLLLRFCREATALALSLDARKTLSAMRACAPDASWQSLLARVMQLLGDEAS